MDKLRMHSQNLTQDNIAKIRELFPGCVTEADDEHGNIKPTVDFDQLRQELSESLVEGPQERYHLDWPGKRQALLTANAPIAKTLRPHRKESLNFDTTQNLFIEGDNLDALKLLQETYLGKVKMIYIDPPYNTGNDFIYEDDFSENTDAFLKRSNQKDESGNRLVTNQQSNGRFHSDWLSMMFARLRLARNLLSDDGVIFISVDDNEVHSLTRLCCEILGSENFVAQLAVQLNPRGRHLDKFVAKTHESILVFVKDAINDLAITGVDKDGRMVEEYNCEDARGRHRLLGLRNRNQSFNPVTRPNLYYPLYVCPQNGEISVSSNTVFTDEVWPDAPDGVKTCWTWSKDKVSQEKEMLTARKTNDEWRIYRKDYLLGTEGDIAKTLVKSVWLSKEISNDYGRRVIKDLFGSAVMDFPKSTELIQTLIQIGSHKDSVVMDFYAGSATTAHAVMGINAQDGGNRKFIMVQISEPCDEKSEAFKAGYKNIAEIGKERIRRAGKKILEETCHKDWNKDVGFRVMKVDTSNMEDVYYTPDNTRQDFLSQITSNIKPDRSPEDLLFQVLLDWGVELSLPIGKETIEGKNVFFVDENALVACFDKGINEALVKKLAGFQPLRVVFTDGGFASDSVKINVEQIFRQLSPGTEVKTI